MRHYLKRMTSVTLVILMVCTMLGACANKAANTGKDLTEYWAADSQVAESLRSYVAKVTNEKDAENFIPVEDRIAVFDMDGTLTCETFYTYYDTMMFINYCLVDHPERYLKS